MASIIFTYLKERYFLMDNDYFNYDEFLNTDELLVNR